MHCGRHYYREPTPQTTRFPLIVAASGVSRWNDDAGFERGYTGFWGIEIVTAGTAVFEQHGTQHALSTGDVFILHEGHANRYRVGPGGLLHKRYLQLKGSGAAAVFAAAGLDATDVIQCTPSHAGDIIALLRTIHRHFAHPSHTTDEAVSMLAYRLVLALSKAIPTDGSSHGYAAKVMAWIRRNIDRPLTSTECAAHAGITVAHLNRLMRDAARCSTKQYVIAQKMAVAANLLRETEHSVTEVAAQTGYEDPLYFSNRFAKFHGRSPSAYRRWARQWK